MYTFEVVFFDGDEMSIEADCVTSYGGEATFTKKGPYTLEIVAVVREYKSIRRGEGS